MTAASVINNNGCGRLASNTDKQVLNAGMLITVNINHDGIGDLGTRRNSDDLCAGESIPRNNRRAVARGENASQTRIIAPDLFNSHFNRCVHLQAQGLGLKEVGIK